MRLEPVSPKDAARALALELGKQKRGRLHRLFGDPSAQRSESSATLWLVLLVALCLTLLFGAFGLVAGLLLAVLAYIIQSPARTIIVRHNAQGAVPRMQCTRCGESIAKAANVCRFCNHQLQ